MSHLSHLAYSRRPGRNLTMLRLIAHTLAVILSAGVIVLANGPADAGPVAVSANGLPPAIAPCIREDGSGNAGKWCVWDARHQGNGRGHSIVVNRYREAYTRVTHRFAHNAGQRWQKRHCWPAVRTRPGCRAVLM